MKNWKKFLVAGFATMTVALGCFGVANLNVASASAETSGLSMASGASIRITGGQISADTGVRFKAVATKDLATTLKTNAQNGAEIGVFMVPQQCISAYDEAKKSNDKLDYFAFMEDTYDKAKADISDTYALGDLSTEKDNNLYVTLMSIKDVNYNLDYQAVAYYTLDGSNYVYTQPSEARRVAQVAHTALTDTNPQVNYTEGQKASLGAIVSKAAQLKAGATEGNVVLENGESLDFNELFTTVTGEAISDFAVESTEEVGEVLPLTDGAITAKPINATNAVGVFHTVSVSGYNGKMSTGFTVKTEAKAQTATIGESAVTAYAASVTADGEVSFPDGSYAGTNTDATGATDVPYVAFNGNYGAGNYAVVDFTGNNMPNFSFFTNMEGNVQNFLNRGGLFMSQVMMWPDGATAASNYKKRYYIYGPNGWAGAWTGKATIEWCLHNSANAANFLGEQGNALTYNVMAQGGKTYRMVVGYDSLDTKTGTVSLTIYLLEKNKSGEGSEYTVLSKAVGITNTAEGFKSLTAGGIVIYGRPYADTDLDKLHGLYTKAELQTAMNEWLGVDDFITENNLTSYNATFSGTKENVGVSFSAGSYKNANTNDTGDTDVPYVAFNKEGGYGAGNYAVVDFTGNNMPNFSFFTNMEGNVQNFLNRGGLFMSQVMMWPDGATAASNYKKRYYIYGPNGWAGAWTGKATIEWCLHNSANAASFLGTQGDALTYNVMADAANASKQYRMVVGYDSLDTTTGTVSLSIILLEKDTTEGATKDYKVLSKAVGITKTEEGFKNLTADGIVIYGRPYQATAIDKIHPLYTSKAALGTAIEGWTGTNPFAS